MSSNAEIVRVGTGAGFAADRLDAAVDLARRGELDALVLECLGERTVAFAHRDRVADPTRGYNAYLERRMRAPVAAVPRRRHRDYHRLQRNEVMPSPAAAAAAGAARSAP
jgi:Acyclic terpene utilisation family protein AtuA